MENSLGPFIKSRERITDTLINAYNLNSKEEEINY